MTQYIDKSALVAEIEKLVDKSKYQKEFARAYRDGNNDALYALKDFINTLEVKEVDLEKVIEEYFKGWTDDYDNGGAACHYQYVQVQDCKAIAKHFFELGLKAQKGE